MDDTHAQARQYARIRYRILLLDTAFSWFLLAFAWQAGLSHAIAVWASSLSSHPAAVLAVYLAVFSTGLYFVDLPLHLYSSYFVEHRFGLSRLSIGGWMRREVKRLLVSGVIGLALVEGLYALFRHTPDRWPLWATAGWIALSVLLARVFPTLLLPIFYRTTRIEEGPLVARLLDLCRRVGVSALGVFRFDLGAETRKANAALAGMGKTRRVLLSDTLISDFTEEEIEGVLAHELGHHRYRHITQFLILSAVGSYIIFLLTDFFARKWAGDLGLSGLDDPAGFPLLWLWLSLVGFVGQPLQNAISRYFEWQCDRFAVRTTSPKSFAEALRKLARLNLADPSPPAWIEWMFYDHPAIMKRVRAAEAAIREAP